MFGTFWTGGLLWSSVVDAGPFLLYFFFQTSNFARPILQSHCEITEILSRLFSEIDLTSQDDLVSNYYNLIINIETKDRPAIYTTSESHAPPPFPRCSPPLSVPLGPQGGRPDGPRDGERGTPSSTLEFTGSVAA